MKIPTVVIFSAAMLLFGAVAANGQGRSDQRLSNTLDATFKSLDRNRDNELSKVEVKADSSLSAAFDTLDVNLNGYITKAEYMAHLERSTAPATDREPPPQPQ